MNFQTIPPVPLAKELLNATFRKSRERANAKQFPGELWQRLQNKHWRMTYPDMLDYNDSGGYAPLRRAIAEGSPGIPVTASVGVASTADHAFADPRGLFRAADEALYNAKADGRDRVSAFVWKKDGAGAAP